MSEVNKRQREGLEIKEVLFLFLGGGFKLLIERIKKEKSNSPSYVTYLT